MSTVILDSLQADSNRPMSARPTDPNPMARNPIPHDTVMRIMRMAMNVLGLVSRGVMHAMVCVVLHWRMHLTWGMPRQQICQMEHRSKIDQLKVLIQKEHKRLSSMQENELV